MEAVCPSEMLVSIYESTTVTVQSREKLEYHEVMDCRNVNFAVNCGKMKTKYQNFTHKRLLKNNHRLPALIQLIRICLGP